MTQTSDRLCGKSLLFMGSSQRRNRFVGYYSGRIVRVKRAKRTAAILSIVVERSDGTRLRLFPEEWEGPRCGIPRPINPQAVTEVDAILKRLAATSI